MDLLSQLPECFLNRLVKACQGEAQSVPNALRLLQKRLMKFVVESHTHTLFVHDQLFRKCVCQDQLIWLLANHGAKELSLGPVSDLGFLQAVRWNKTESLTLTLTSIDNGYVPSFLEAVSRKLHSEPNQVNRLFVDLYGGQSVLDLSSLTGLKDFERIHVRREKNVPRCLVVLAQKRYTSLVLDGVEVRWGGGELAVPRVDQLLLRNGAGLGRKARAVVEDLTFDPDLLDQSPNTQLDEIQGLRSVAAPEAMFDRMKARHLTGLTQVYMLSTGEVDEHRFSFGDSLTSVRGNGFMPVTSLAGGVVGRGSDLYMDSVRFRFWQDDESEVLGRLVGVGSAAFNQGQIVVTVPARYMDLFVRLNAQQLLTLELMDLVCDGFAAVGKLQGLTALTVLYCRATSDGQGLIDEGLLPCLESFTTDFVTGSKLFKSLGRVRCKELTLVGVGDYAFLEGLATLFPETEELTVDALEFEGGDALGLSLLLARMPRLRRLYLTNMRGSLPVLPAKLVALDVTNCQLMSLSGMCALARLATVRFSKCHFKGAAACEHAFTGLHVSGSALDSVSLMDCVVDNPVPLLPLPRCDVLEFNIRVVGATSRCCRSGGSSKMDAMMGFCPPHMGQTFVTHGVHGEKPCTDFTNVVDEQGGVFCFEA